MTPAWEVVIGLEVHAQLLTRSKMFCGCPTTFGAGPNTQTCPVCLGMPGTLPVINRRAIEYSTRTALAFNCRINPACRFARKHYYYPDMPKNFQISQYEEPLAEEGGLEIDVDGGTRRIGIQRLHLEEDVGKLVHDGTLETAQSSLVDFNRAGVPLMETVSKPEIRSPEEAAAYLRAFRSVLVYLGVCDGNMEEGSMRCDANISLRRPGAKELGTKVEIKNLNSFRNVQHALEFEVKRQTKALEAGEKLVQETRLWDADKGYTKSMRSKEFAHDYRYFPEPDLVPLELDDGFVDGVRAALPELARQQQQRFVTQYGLPAYDAGVLTQSRALAEYFETTVKGGATAKVASNWIMSELLRVVPGDDERAIRESPVPPAHLAGLIKLIDDGTISGKIAKDVFEKMARSREDAATIVQREGLTQVADTGALSAIVDQVIAANPKAIADWKAGKTAAAKSLVGQVMKATQGKANPAIVNRLIEEKLPEIAGKATSGAVSLGERTLAELEPLYFLDYSLFTGAVRHYASRTLEDAFKQDPNPIRRKLHFVNLVKEEYAAYEDTGAMLKALLDYRAGRVTLPLTVLIDFKARDVELVRVFESHKVASGEALWEALRLQEWIPTEWTNWLPHLDLKKALRLACKFFVEDCAQNQKRPGIVAYNKIKHGLMVVPSARTYLREQPDGPAAIFPNPRDEDKASKPYELYGFDPTDSQIENRHASIEFVQCNLRLLSGLYVSWRYPASLPARGFADMRELALSDSWYDVRHLIGEVTAKK
jgi:aspartyl-tRNA(Asn)/glutamyl-tRNA(Gln) amidotransferase subunit B